MTDRARELLERAIESLQENEVEPHSALQEEILSYLAEPEAKPLSDEEMSKGFIWYGPKHQVNQYEIFKLGVRFAEKHHGIGGGDE